QAEDGIRDFHVTGVQTCALPIFSFGQARTGRRLPTVFSADEAARVVAAMEGEYRLMAQLMYGSGLRVSECIRLRVKDVDFDMNRSEERRVGKECRSCWT